MKAIIFLFLISAGLLSAHERGEIILLFGTPCAGKSTLANELKTALPGNFKVVKKTNRMNALRNEALMRTTGKTYETSKQILNAMLEMPNDEQLELKNHSIIAYLATLEDVKKMSDRGENVILDVCLSRLIGIDTFDGYPVTKVLVYAPLNTLSFREKVRTIKNQDSILVHQRRRKTVLNFYYKLYRQSGKGEHPLDFVSRFEVERYAAVTKNKIIYPSLIKSFQKVKKLYKFKGSERIGITPTVPYDLIVNTGTHSSAECAAKVNGYLEDYSKLATLEK